MIDINGLRISLAGVWTATFVSCLIGFLWYGMIFARRWTTEMGYDSKMRPDGKTMAKGIFLMVIGNFLFAWIFAFYLAGWRFIPGNNQIGTATFALNSAISACVGFYIPVHLSRVVWEKHSWTLFLLNSGYHLVATGCVALILVHTIEK
jgi:hypothetical protein